jgi:hypothetical protein
MAGMSPVRGLSGALVVIKVAHGLYRRWEGLGPQDRERLGGLAERAKSAALELRGRTDRAAAEAELTKANEELAGAIADAAASDPEATTTEIEALRADLRRELERVENARRRGQPPAQAA